VQGVGAVVEGVGRERRSLYHSLIERVLGQAYLFRKVRGADVGCRV